MVGLFGLGECGNAEEESGPWWQGGDRLCGSAEAGSCFASHGALQFVRLVQSAGHVGISWAVPRGVGGRGPASTLSSCLSGGGLRR